MKYIFGNVALISGLLLGLTPGFAQEHDSALVIQKIRQDVNQLPSVKSLLSEEDQYSLVRINRDLDELQQSAFDQRTFDDVTYILQSALNNRSLAGRDRQILQEDLNLLRGTAYADTQAFVK